MANYLYSRNFWRFDTIQTFGPDSSLTNSIDAGSIQIDRGSSGGQNPAWRSQVANHKNATTEFSAHRFRVSGSTSGYASYSLQSISPASDSQEIKRVSQGDLIDASDITLLDSFSDASLESEVTNRAALGFILACKNELRSFQGGVFLGELRETIHMLKNPARSFRRALDFYSRDVNRRLKSRGLRRGIRPSPAKISDLNKVVSDTWLEHSFGWQPFLSDIRSAGAAFVELALKPLEIKIARYRYSKDVTDPVYTEIQYRKILQNGIAYIVRRVPSVGYSTWYKGAVKVQVNSPLQLGENVLGFAPSDFFPTIWELIPYSFLVDYFTNIGQVIEAWSFPMGNIAWHFRTQRRYRKMVLTAEFDMTPYNPNPGLWTWQNASGSSFKVDMDNTILSRDAIPIGIPTFQFRVPGSSLKWMNIAALAHMRFPS
ncbi:TPA_asm: maturation protein [ssRNA phage Gerhypos.2_22]|uniref:Maturation protein n=2 Tax=Norzivirales TaxID=2842247 RepID=A0A8S5KZZ4_9VIRU|nr:maturation protein [ssRNA phage Gerhypos.2_22]QDH86509.1 MAG: hypothetical protein H2Bulk35312_000001 [Leviviridae sp.]DAD50426.1 TPA_asm: maturation protein [ssRNA phage Gerhypos.2_22]